ncbi:hypothetical protein IP92_03643 [Pseudoduganella flava]|uniref:Lipoprotein n=1 Tax=Pseudoduganella flava TaxID=871742 RepID=A0A562PLH3_9BURK|nr:hypothetical protein [Pseudoduganella flava]QGZ41037.1 hypothetical protein GO485_19500 [Pseudoduganella flava]TWI45267.1 hypothetical protein IP92_03643 [Pseudoduganella flava]
MAPPTTFPALRRLACAAGAALALTGCGTPGGTPWPLTDAQSAHPAGKEYGEYLQDNWTTDSFVMLRRSRLLPAEQRVLLLLLTLPMAVGGAHCAPGEMLEIVQVDGGRDEVWKARVCGKVVETPSAQRAGGPCPAGAGTTDTAGGTSLACNARPAFATAAEFRRLHPAPAQLEAAVAAHAAANARLVERARTGLRTDVHLVAPDGAAQEGYDEYFAAPPVRFREVRSERESIIVGDSICRKPARGTFRCENLPPDMNMDFGMRKLVPDAIMSIAQSTVACGQARCTSYEIVQAASLEENGRWLVTAEPDLNQYVLTLVVTPDGMPYSFRERERSNGKATGMDATFRYAYGTAVASFALPASGSR